VGWCGVVVGWCGEGWLVGRGGLGSVGGLVVPVCLFSDHAAPSVHTHRH
jgi:hypothetical protein